jgi:hypothetical protein
MIGTRPEQAQTKMLGQIWEISANCYDCNASLTVGALIVLLVILEKQKMGVSY